MKMRDFRTVALIAFVCVCMSTTADAQSRKRRVTASSPAAVAPFDSARWRAEHYVVDRDSAYADPHIGLRKLMGGNRRFVEDKSIRPRQSRAVLLSTEKGQKPFAVIVGCSDSRVPNEIVFDQGVGDLFIVRTAGQVMAAASYGSIEFATIALGAKLVIVMGHQNCGAVDAALKRPDVPGHIVTLVNSIKSAAQKARTMGGDLLTNAIRQNVIEQVNELRDLEPVLSKKYQKGEILVVGAVYNLGSGKVEFIPETLTDLPKQTAATK